MKVELSDEAKAEIRAAREHYENDQPGLGRELVLELRDLVRKIADGP
jgi:plasmid stabilization system protein ParE